MTRARTARPSLYVHVPFCRSRCSYCDFHSSVPGDDIDERAGLFVDAVRRHLEHFAREDGVDAYDTVYVGGGTPTSLSRGRLAELLAAIRSASAATPLEWTLEANPDDLDAELLDALASGGVTRLSIGVQSLEDDARRLAARRGSAESVSRALELVSEAWKGSWSADLIYGLPGQSAAGLARDLRFLSSLGAGHLSAYELTLEEGTPLAAALASGRAALPREEELDDMYDAVAGTLSAEGFERYEVSNWARDGRRCEHNMRYWRLDDWYAAGPAGVGNAYLGDGAFMRTENSRNDAEYCGDPAGSASRRRVQGREAMVEALMVALRTSDGLDLGAFERRFGVAAPLVFGQLDTAHPGLVALEGGRWKPTERGLDILNVVLVDALGQAELYEASPRHHPEGRRS